MTWFFEASPVWIIVLGLLLAAMLVGGWIQTGQKALLYAAGAAVVLTSLLLLAERMVETDREQVERTLHEIARDVERNDLQAVLRHIYSGAPEIRDRAASEFPNYTFKEVRITRLRKIDVVPKHLPPKAVAEFNVVVVGSDRQGLLNDQQVPRFVVVTFYQESDGRWAVADYQHYDPQEGFKKSPAGSSQQNF